MALQATGDAQEPIAAFDVAADRFEKRLRRYKRRLKSHGPGGNGNPTDIAYTVVAPVADDEDEVPEDYAPAIVAESTLTSENHVGRVSRHRTRYEGQSRFCLPQCRKRSRQCGLSQSRWKYRLDRSVVSPGQGLGATLDRTVGRGAWRRVRTGQRIRKEWISVI